jgi:hypothetical protein
MDLRDLTLAPRALALLAEMSRHVDPFSESALIAASGLSTRQRVRDLCAEMQAWGLVEIVSLSHGRGRYAQATALGRRVGRLAEEIHRALQDSPARFHGDNRIPSKPAGGP